MSDITVSISLSKAQQGKLYMQNMRRGERIKELKAGLREIIEMAEQIEIATKARALLEPAATQPKEGGTA